MKNKLIIFDCDGVLVDSEPISCGTIAQQFTALGLTMTTEEAIHLFAGGSLTRVIDYFKIKMGANVPEDFEDVYRERSYSAFKKSLNAVPGIQRVLENLPFKKCVASNGPLPKMKLNLDITGLNHFFDKNLFSAYEIGHWKPDPKLFLYAAENMGFNPGECIVIEDSSHGVQAAKAAGMRILGYAGRTPRQKLEDAGAEVFTDMGDLLDLLN